VRPLITHRFRFDQAIDAYGAIADKEALGIILEYDAQKSASVVTDRMVLIPQQPDRAQRATGMPVIGVIGAGGFTGQVLLPALKQTGARLKSIASAAGVTGTHLAGKFRFEVSTTDAESILADSEVDTVLVTTRHNSHARYVIEGLRRGKRVYVEKPLCLDEQELAEISGAYAAARQPFLMVGFNRRFSPHVGKMQSLLGSTKEPKTMIMTVNAGAIPRSHWTQDPDVGGGRIIGEACHHIDLLRLLAGAPITEVQAMQMGAAAAQENDDKMTFTLKFADGSLGTVHYFANGHRSFPKERLEVFCGGRILQLDNFRKLNGFGWPGFKTMAPWRQDKGHAAEMQALVDALEKGGPSPTPFDQLVEVTQASFDVVRRASAS
jgi:predicted dehydrogenase